MTMETPLDFPIPKKSIQKYPNIFMVSRWGSDSYFNNEQIGFFIFEIMTSRYVSSG